jgi:hypothetical protein
VHVQLHPAEGWVVPTPQPVHHGMPTAALPGGEVALRNSRNAGDPALMLRRSEMAAFLAGPTDGEFDDYAG